LQLANSAEVIELAALGKWPYNSRLRLGMEKLTLPIFSGKISNSEKKHNQLEI
jgi:hypothetical protein